MRVRANEETTTLSNYEMDQSSTGDRVVMRSAAFVGILWLQASDSGHNRRGVAPQEEDSPSEYGSDEYPEARSRATKRSKARRPAYTNHR